MRSGAAADGEVIRDAQRVCYGFGERLLAARLPVTFLVATLTLFFASRAARLSMATSLDDLLPANHAFVDVHKRYAAAFGGASNLVIMLEARRGDIFSAEHLTQLVRITAAVDTLPRVNHGRTDSIAYRTSRHLGVGRRGAVKSEPLMRGAPQSDKEVETIRRAVHRTPTVYGSLVSTDDKAAIVRVDFLDGQLDYRRIFDELERKALVPYVYGWIGAEMQPLVPDADAKTDNEISTRVLVTRVFADSAAASAGLQKGDVITAVNGVPLRETGDIPAAVKAADGAGVEIGYERDGEPASLTLTGGGSDLEASVAGDSQLYGWLYREAAQLVWIFAVAAGFVWFALFLYYRDWRGALRPTVTSVVAAVWGLGLIELIGLPIDPLGLVVPFFLTARALSHSVQMHDRYYDEYLATRFRKREAILSSYAALFVPTLSAILSDAAGVFVLLLIPVPMLQKLAVTASFWILAIAVAELVWNPILYDVLRAPEQRAVYRRAAARFGEVMAAAYSAVMSPKGRQATFAFWLGLAVLCATQWPNLTIGDAGPGSPLLYPDSSYNQAHRRIQARFGGVEPLVVVAESRDKDAMKDPRVLAKMEDFQRFLERDPAVGFSLSLADVARSINMLYHELEPKWGVVPDAWADAGNLFFLYFSGNMSSEIARYASADYRSAPVTFFLRDHSGESVARVIARARHFIAANPLPNARFSLATGTVGALAAANESLASMDVWMTLLALTAICVVVAFTYRSFVAGLLLLVPLVVANCVVNAFLGWRGTGIGLNTLPVVAVGIGFGVDFGLYLMSHTVEAYGWLTATNRSKPPAEQLFAALLIAMKTTGKAITFTALTVIVATSFWAASSIRFDAEMGLLLALWTAVSAAASLTLLPVLVYFAQPAFLRRGSTSASTQLEVLSPPLALAEPRR